MRPLYKITIILIILGAINWGMVGIFNINLVELVLGKDTLITNLVYSLIGISGLITTGVLFDTLDEE